MNSFAVDLLTAKSGETHLFSAGQAGFVLKSKNGQFLGVDLYLSECVERIEGNTGFKRLLPRILDPFEIQFDCLVATHTHWDHFDVDAMPLLMSNPKTKLFASVDCQKEIQRLNMLEKNVAYVKPGDTRTCGDFTIDFINCDHGTGAPDAVGLIITVDDQKICMVGDSCLRMDRIDEYLSKGAIDVLVGPINGAFGNLNEKEFAALSNALKPRLTIPCHYGMFASHGGNPGEFYTIMTTQYPDIAFAFLRMGEGITL
ncbi:MAG: MBL fold metallo-hydrolase [Clostridia bacterium]|nr:MBL fold metallo-hydrolase [Clostridia bacterium]